MPTTKRFSALSRTAWTAAAVFSLSLSSPRTARAQSLPARLSDSAFWKLVTDLSEPGGFFRSDNFVSNETHYQWVIPDLLRTAGTGGVYLGVGPDQNFTYLVAMQPKVAFIFDIRRQNLLTHLLYKTLIEQSTDRADFLSKLFSRTRPAGLDTTSTSEALLRAYAASAADSVLYRKNVAAIKADVAKHGFTISEDDWATIGYVYNAFFVAGPDINYNFSQNRGYGRSRMPSYADLQIATDSAGLHRSYLGSEANFRVLKDMETRNVIVPLVGDFAGPKAIRAVAGYLKANHAVVSAFYLSNVEQYLFQQADDGRKFYGNVSALPLDGTSTFIRSVFSGMGGYYGGANGGQQMLASMLEQVKLFNAGKLTSYGDVINSSR